jgi:hypothetical protein
VFAKFVSRAMAAVVVVLAVAIGSRVAGGRGAAHATCPNADRGRLARRHLRPGIRSVSAVTQTIWKEKRCVVPRKTRKQLLGRLERVTQAASERELRRLQRELGAMRRQFRAVRREARLLELGEGVKDEQGGPPNE